MNWNASNENELRKRKLNGSDLKQRNLNRSELRQRNLNKSALMNYSELGVNMIETEPNECGRNLNGFIGRLKMKLTVNFWTLINTPLLIRDFVSLVISY